jgi:hypothetical protein
MAARNTITVDDRESSPVSHSFVPVGDKDNMALFREAGVVPEVDSKLNISWKLDGPKRKVRMTLAVPKAVTETINGVDRTTSQFVNYGDVTFTYSSQSTLQERKNLVGMFANALAASVTVVDSTVTGLEEIW